MSFNSGPNFPSFSFEESGVSGLERLDFMRSVAAEIEATAHEFAAREINRDPVLHTLLSTIIEGGAELDPQYLSHLRKIATLRLAALQDVAIQVAQDQEFFTLMSVTLRSEINELDTLAEANELPDMWDIAYRDLLQLEDDQGN